MKKYSIENSTLSVRFKILLCFFLVLITLTGCNNNTRKNQDTLLYSILEGDFDKTRELIDSGVDINYQNSPLGNGALHACLLNKEENTGILAFLIEKGANLNMQNSEGSTPLKFAVVNKRIASIKVLLEHGADVNIKDRYGLKVTDYLDKEEDAEIFKLFHPDG